jgi:tellurite resistance protein TerC
MSTPRAAWLSVGWLLIGLAVTAPLLWLFGAERAVSYGAVYLVERSLSLDNVFIFLLILDYFEVPRHYRRRVVWWGIALALLVRAAAIALGVQLITRFSVVTYLLGAALVAFAVRMLRTPGEPVDPEAGRVVRLVRRVVPLTRDTASGRFVTRHDGRRAVTPIGLALLALVAADITFAVDSIPAAFGITTDALAIWLANALALVGLVPLLVLVRALVKRFRYMRQTLSAVLVFIGVRLLTEHVVAIGPLPSLAGILAILGVGMLVSLIADRRQPPDERALAERRPPRCPPDHVRARPTGAHAGSHA